METKQLSLNFSRKDKMLVAIVFCLAGFGMIMIYSASAMTALQKYGDSFYFLKKQFAWMILSVIAMLVVSRMDLDILKRLHFPLIALSCILLVLVLIPGVGSEINNSRRWFRLGPLSLQPSELAKVSVIIYLSTYLAKKGERIQDFVNGFVPPLLVVGLISLLVVVEPDLGTVLVICGGSGILLFIGGARILHISGLFLTCLPAVILLIVNVGYRAKRITAFLHPWDDPDGTGYQIVQSFLAFGNGGIFGRGVGGGRQKLFFLPEAHTDFIFSVAGEELGFTGCVAIIILFIFFLWRCFRIIRNHWGSFEGYLASGITIFIAIQIIINMYVVTGLFPTKGLALPFLSFGGTSLLTNMVLVGLLYSISGRSPVKHQVEVRTNGKFRTLIKTH
ncbi:MAG: putative lipid II flippase FtsW [Nitrospirae bacterium]|nr:putative lipid II flippase FtsW [Nitrospirota bacterium]